MDRLLESLFSLAQTLARLAGVSAVVLLALALAIGAHGAVLGALHSSPVIPFSSFCLSEEIGLEEISPEEDANLAEAERDLPFDSGASTGSDRHSFGGKDLVRFLSHRPVIIFTPGGSTYGGSR
jgi:hypothetical protein